MSRFFDDVLLVFALYAEAEEAFRDTKALYCGVGKVNAAYRLTLALEAWRREHSAPPRLVLNLGSAGSTHFPKGSIVNCTRFVQRDFDVTVLGHVPYMTPSELLPASLSTGLRFDAFPEGVCGTGDHFVTQGKMEDWNVVDMEGYALAKVSLLEKVPFACLKYITDGGDEEAAKIWDAEVQSAPLALRAAAEAALKGL